VNCKKEGYPICKAVNPPGYFRRLDPDFGPNLLVVSMKISVSNLPHKHGPTNYIDFPMFTAKVIAL